MAIKVKEVERNVSFDKNSEKWVYVLQADLYNKLSDAKVITEAVLRCSNPCFELWLLLHYVARLGDGGQVPVPSVKIRELWVYSLNAA